MTMHFLKLKNNPISVRNSSKRCIYREIEVQKSCDRRALRWIRFGPGRCGPEVRCRFFSIECLSLCGIQFKFYPHRIQLCYFSHEPFYIQFYLSNFFFFFTMDVSLFIMEFLFPLQLIFFQRIWFNELNLIFMESSW